jgi:hypothetical protein
MNLIKGKSYSRKEISKSLGGSGQSYLPTKNGKITCGCFTTKLNPTAPEEVLIGDINRKSAEILSEQEESIPVFIKRDIDVWEYVGDYKCVDYSTEPTLLRQKEKQYPERGKITAILQFESVASSWLYPIAERAERFFLLKGGGKVDVSVSSYKKLVKNSRLPEDNWWGISQNFNKVEIGDKVYIYTGDEDLGIIGYAIVKDKRGDNKNDWELCLNFDLDKCRQLIQDPIPADIVRLWIRGRIKTVNNLDSVQSKLEKILQWQTHVAPTTVTSNPSPPEREIVEVSRPIRDNQISKDLKRLYGNKCQICQTLIKLSERNYSETHHLQPLGNPHNGFDVQENMLVVCPNHHAQLDYGAITIDPNTLEVTHRNGSKVGKLIVSPNHKLNKRYLKYHLDFYTK